MRIESSPLTWKAPEFEGKNWPGKAYPLARATRDEILGDNGETSATASQKHLHSAEIRLEDAQ